MSNQRVNTAKTIVAAAALAACFSSCVFGIARIARAEDNKCCQTVNPFGPCSGCVEVIGKYYQVGDHPAEKCVSTHAAKDCDETNLSCFSGNYTEYALAGCSGVLGTNNVTKATPQCDENDDQCGS